MKKQIFYSLFLIIFGFNPLNSQIINKWDSTYRVKGSFSNLNRQNNLISLDKDNILLIDQISLNTAPFLALTNDGGIKWDTIFKSKSFEYEINSIAFPSKNNIVWVGDTTEFQTYDKYYNSYYLRSGVIFTSTNGGLDWHNTKLDTNTMVDYVAMLNENTGIANLRQVGNYYNDDLNYYDTLLYTTDFFKTYTKIPIPDSLTFIEKIDIFSENNFIVKTSNFHLSKYKYLETTDKGVTWTEIADAYNISDLFFLNRQITYKIQTEATSNPNIWISKIFKSIDGCKNWIYCFTPTDSYWSDYRVIRIAASDIDNALAIGTNGAIYRTEDGGKNWQKEFASNISGGYAMEYNDFFYITYPEKNIAYIAGGFGSEYLLKMNGTKILSRPNLNRYMEDISPIGVKAFWNPVIGAKKYNLQIAFTNSDTYDIKIFDKLTVDEIITDTVFTLPDLDYNSCYYGRIKAIADDMESEWNIKAPMFCTFESSDYTHPPVFIFPLKGTSIKTLNCEFKWNKINEAEEYQLQFCDNPYFAGTISNIEHIKDTVFLSEDLVYGVKYYARVKVSKGSKTTNWTTTDFIVLDPSNVINIDLGNRSIINVYPNPASEYLEINLSGTNSFLINNSDDNNRIMVINMLGELSLISNQSIIDNETIKLDVSKLSSGMYFLKIGNIITKFVKK